MSIHYLKTLCFICAAGAMTLTSTLFAQDDDNVFDEDDSQEIAQIELSDHSETCIAKLSKAVNLKPSQKQEIHDVYLQSESAQKATWEKFSQAQRSVIAIEAEMYASIGSRMTESQRQTFTSARNGQHDKMVAKSNGTVSPKKIKETSGRKSKSANKSRRGSSKTQTTKPKMLTASESFVQTSIITPMEEVVDSVGLNGDESAKCKTACHAYHTKLNVAWAKVERLRKELVNQEANTIKAVSKVLTEEQILELEKHRTLALK